MKILLLYEGYDEYTVQLWTNIKKYDGNNRVSLLTTKGAEEQYKKRLTLDEGEMIYTEPDSSMRSVLDCIRIIREFPRFDVIHFSYMEIKWGILAPMFRRRTDRLIISVGGSDLYRTAQKIRKRILQMRLIRRADMLSSENTHTRDHFYRVYGGWTKKIPHRICRYGVDVIDAIRSYDKTDIDRVKEIWDLPKDKLIVMIGHNGSDKHQHLDVIEAVSRMQTGVIDKCFFLIPMTYGTPSAEYRATIEEAVSKITGNYRIFDEYLSVDQMAQTTIVTDVMIHVQTTDQLSSTMMAHLYNANIVIAGSWLPYDDIKDAGIKLYDVDTINGITELLSDISVRTDKYRQECVGNPERVYRFSSWECCMDNWMDMYETVLKG